VSPSDFLSRFGSSSVSATASLSSLRSRSRGSSRDLRDPMNSGSMPDRNGKIPTFQGGRSMIGLTGAPRTKPGAHPARRLWAAIRMRPMNKSGSLRQRSQYSKTDQQGTIVIQCRPDQRCFNSEPKTSTKSLYRCSVSAEKRNTPHPEPCLPIVPLSTAKPDC
jgi:hypothetical protein